MINIFDLSVGLPGTKMRTEKVQRDGSPIQRNQPDVVKNSFEHVKDQMDSTLITHEKRSPNKIFNGTPIKMLIAQEMSKELEARGNPLTLIAKLMGLDALPGQPLLKTAQESVTGCNSHITYATSRYACGCQKQNTGYCKKMLPSHPNKNMAYKNVYESWEQSSRISRFRDEPFSNRRFREHPNENRVALVRQKFMEAKKLAANQKALHSKEFQDTLEVLSSNRDIFLGFLEEPNSLLSMNMDELRTAFLPGQAKRITVLKPSKALDVRTEDRLKEDKHFLAPNEMHMNMYDRTSDFLDPKINNSSQPTRIVVLKPTPGKFHDLQPDMVSPTLFPATPQKLDVFEEIRSSETKESRDMAWEITQKMQEGFSHRRDETLLSSVPSNGYTGDESSFHASEEEYLEDAGNLSDLEIASLSPQHSWDYTSRFDSPPLQTSLSLVSHTVESSVVREAKKRLSERCRRSQEQLQFRHSTSTLGEMLSSSGFKKEKDVVPPFSSSRSCSGTCTEEVSTSCSYKNADEREDRNSVRGLRRSKSVPASSSVYEYVGSDSEVSGSVAGEAMIPKKNVEPKCKKLSLKEKISSFFSFKNKKSVKGKSTISSSTGSRDFVQSDNMEYHDLRSDDSFPCVNGFKPYGPLRMLEESLQNKLNGVSDQCTGKQGITTTKAFENTSGSHEELSFISVLEAPSKDASKYGSLQCFDGSNIECHRTISRSPPIGSIARSLSWDDGTHLETRTCKSSACLTNFWNADMLEQERTLFVQKLLISAGLADETPSTSMTRWHSFESPLNSALLDNFLEGKDSEATRCRARRSYQRLLFDCVNVALLDINRNSTSDACIWLIDRFSVSDGIFDTNTVTEHVLECIQKWFSEYESQPSAPSDNSSSSLTVDCILRKEMYGKSWSEHMRSATAEIGRVIEKQVLEELVGEALHDFIFG